MDKFKRYALLALILITLAFLGVVGYPYLMSSIITPLATATWLFLRLFVLSIDQKYYWGAVIILGVLLAARRFLAGVEITETSSPLQANSTLQKIDIWRMDILFAVNEGVDRSNICRELSKLLVTMYTSRQQKASALETLEALKQRQLPVPDRVHDFLFPDVPEKPAGLLLWRYLQSIRSSFWKRMRQWTGRESRDYYQAFEETIAFMENSLEINHDHD